jgi:hypothetical protein
MQIPPETFFESFSCSNELGKGEDDEDDVVCIFMYVCVLLLYVCMFLCIHTCNVSTSARGSWSSAPEAAGISNRVAGIEKLPEATG